MSRFRKIAKGLAQPELSFGTWDDFQAAGHKLVTVCHPEWRGVRAAAYSFREPVVEVADARVDGLAVDMANAGAEVVVVHGFPPGTHVLLDRAKALGLATRCVLHSSPSQHGADAGEAEVVDRVFELKATGVLDRVGFVKEGVAEAFAALGHEVVYVPNRVPDLPDFERVRLGRKRRHVGVFVEPYWRKNAVAQLAGVALMENARAHVIRRPDVKYLASLNVVEHGELPWEEFIALQGSVHVNLYVTLSECYPMSPMESYTAGVPCLTSRTSALFRSDPELWTLTTVSEADNPRAIAAAATRLLERKDEAVERAGSWMKIADEEARHRWEAFTEA